MLGVHVGDVELEELRDACETRRVTFPTRLDAGTDQTPGSPLSRYRVGYYPTTLIIDRTGAMAWSSATSQRPK